MKTRKLALIYTAILASILLGATAINISAATEITLYVLWYPSSYTLDNPTPDPWSAIVFLSGFRRTTDINTATIRLEGIYIPESTTPWLWNLLMTIKFDGMDVLYALLLKAGHIAPGKYKISLEITGQLKDGTPFRGSGSISLTIPEAPPP